MQLGHRIVMLGATSVLLVGGMGAAALVGAGKGDAVRTRAISDRAQLDAAYLMAIDARELRRTSRLEDAEEMAGVAARLRKRLARFRPLLHRGADAEVAANDLRLAEAIEGALVTTLSAPPASGAAFAANEALIEAIDRAIESEQREMAQVDATATAVIRTMRLAGLIIPPLALILISALSISLLLPVRRRMRELLAGTERLRRGDTTTEIPAAAGDELARLAVAYNDLQRELRSTTVSRTELEEHLVALREAREQLVVADRMALVGTLAAGVAHEINNPLAYLSSNLEWVRSDLLLGGKVRTELIRALDEAADGAARIASIVGDLRAFSREDETRIEVDLRQVVEDAIRLAGHEVRQVASLERCLDPVPPVLGNRMRLGQVVLNLLVNAAQSLPADRAGRGSILIRTGSDRDGCAIVEVEDDGPGVPEEIRHRIFDPFFSTKPIGVGTGLGLSVCNGIVAAHGGSLEYEARPGGGSLFRVTLHAVGGIPMI